MKTIVLRSLAWTLALAWGLLATGEAPAQEVPEWSTHPMLGTDAPEFSLEGVDGDTLSLGELRGQFVVIHFGASW